MAEITGIGKWREKHAGQLVTLPSGNVARLRRVHVLDLAGQGAIPAPLAGLVSELIESGKRTISLEELGQYVELINLVAKAAFVEPRVGDEAAEDQLAVNEVDMADRLAVFAWSHPEGERLLRGFRAKQAQPVGAAQPGRRVRPPAQRVPRG